MEEEEEAEADIFISEISLSLFFFVQKFALKNVRVVLYSKSNQLIWNEERRREFFFFPSELNKTKYNKNQLKCK